MTANLPATPPPVRASILIVDDEVGILEAYERCLQPQRRQRIVSARRRAQGVAEEIESGAGQTPYRIIRASSGLEAVERVRRELRAGRRIAAGFFDMRMPGELDGIETIKRVRSIDPWLNFTIVTAYQDRDVDEIHRMLSPDGSAEWDYISKPFTDYEIRQRARSMVSSWLRRRQEEGFQRAMSALLDSVQRAGAGSAPESNGREALQLVAHMLGTRRGSIVAVPSDSELEPVTVDHLPQGGCAIASPEAQRLIRRAAGSGVAWAPGLAAVALPGPWPRQVVVCADFLAPSQHLEAFVQLLCENLDRAREHSADRERLATLGRVSAGLAHEINNPLTWTLANLQVARQGCELLASRCMDSPETEALRQEVCEAQDSLKVGLDRIADIVRNMKRISRRDEERPQPVQLDDALESAVAVSAGTIKPVAELVTQLDSGAVVLAHEGRLVQIVVNLLSNAAHAVAARVELDPDHEPRGEVRVRSWRETDTVLVEVTDTGNGIPREHLSRIWEPFFTTKSRGDGSGLGLALARDMIEAYGGSIDVRSQPRVGTTFQLRFPVLEELSQPPAPRMDVADAEADAEHLEPPGRILVIDDEPRILDALAAQLGRRHHLVLCRSAPEALERLTREADFDLVLCDLVMPGMNGLRFRHRLQQVHPKLISRFVLMTGGPCTLGTTKDLASYRGPLIEKPLETDAIETALARARVQARA